MKMRAWMSLPFICLFFSSCYVVSQAGPFLSQRMRAVPLEKLLADDNIPDDMKSMLHEVIAIRAFASEELGLSRSRNYSRLVSLDRDYLAAVIQAAGEFSTEPWLFGYPVIGKLPYRGYYDIEKAIEYAQRLEKKGLDVFVRKVDAFSSLGFFSDPLYSFMVSYPVSRLAELIIHEETHATVFLKGYPEFNERLAMFTGKKGAELYMRGRSCKDDASVEEHYTAFRKDIFILAETLEEVYAQAVNDDVKREHKRRILAEFRLRHELPFEINNAYISLYKIYEEPDNTIETLYSHLGSISALMEFFLDVKKRNADPRDAMKSYLAAYL